MYDKYPKIPLGLYFDSNPVNYQGEYCYIKHLTKTVWDEVDFTLKIIIDIDSILLSFLLLYLHKLVDSYLLLIKQLA